MLKATQRIHKQKEFDQFFGPVFKKRRGLNLSTPNLIFKFFLGTQKRPRCAFIVSNKVDKRATVRNRIKRQMREIMREQLKFIKCPAEMLIMAQPRIAKAEFKDIKQEILTLLRRARLI